MWADARVERDGTSGLDQHAARSIGLAPSRLGLAVRRRPPLRPTAFAPAHRDAEGVHRQHGSRGAAGTTLDRGVDRPQRVRDPRQLRLAPGRLRNRAAAANVVGPPLQVRDAQRAESSVPLQSELRRLRLAVFDRPITRGVHDGQRVKRLIHEQREWLHRTHQQGTPALERA